MIFIFDLDETLYVEKNFVLSGFKVVAKYLNVKHNFNYQNTFKDLKTIHKDIYLHMIGPLQTNKVKKALEIFDFFHSLDRQSLALEFSKHPNRIKHKSFFIQVNTGNEKQKSGILSDLASEFIQYCLNALKLNIIGLMCLPPISEDPKKHFTLLKDLAQKNNLNKLSMGMSADYEIALNCGSTHIRVGSILFTN